MCGMNYEKAPSSIKLTDADGHTRHWTSPESYLDYCDRVYQIDGTTMRLLKKKTIYETDLQELVRDALPALSTKRKAFPGLRENDLEPPSKMARDSKAGIILCMST